MEAGDGLVEGVGGVIPQQPLEAAEGPTGGGEQLRRLGGLVAYSALHKGEGAPHAARAVGDAGGPVPGAQDGQGFPGGITAQPRDFPAQVLRDVDDVLHQLVRLLEGDGADPLENGPAHAPVRSPGVHPESVVDVPLAESGGALHRPAEVVGGQRLLEGLLCLYHTHYRLLLTLYVIRPCSRWDWWTAICKRRRTSHQCPAGPPSPARPWPWPGRRSKRRCRRGGGVR